jgi:hypothetical protein
MQFLFLYIDNLSKLINYEEAEFLLRNRIEHLTDSIRSLVNQFLYYSSENWYDVETINSIIDVPCNRKITGS